LQATESWTTWDQYVTGTLNTSNNDLLYPPCCPVVDTNGSPGKADQPFCLPGDNCVGFEHSITLEAWPSVVQPDLDQSNPFVRRMELDWARCFVETYDADAVRLDTALHMERSFLAELQEAVGCCAAAVRDNNCKAIILGDLNMGPEASPANYDFLLQRGYRDAVLAAAEEGTEITTWDPKNPLNQKGPHASSPPQRCDHVFLHASCSLVPAAAERVFTDAFIPTEDGLVTLSDHYGLQVTFQAAPSGTRTQ